jgi:hypothetical protein
MIKKPVADLTLADVSQAVIWKFVDDGGGEDRVTPVSVTLPLGDLRGLLVRTEIKLANNEVRYALVGNIDPTDAQQNKHFLTFTVFDAAGSFQLARYHDVGASRHGPEQLARFLNRNVDDVFPIEYDLTREVGGDRSVLAGAVKRIPDEQLPVAELIRLAMK